MKSGDPIHLALGFFDGVHLGHQAVIASAQKAAQLLGGEVHLMSFANHPLNYLNPAQAPPLITPDLQEKKDILEHLGITQCWFETFDACMASLSPDAFIHYVMQKGNIRSISVGEDWRFGKGKLGDASLLKEWGERLGFDVHIIPDYCDGVGNRISSTLIREAIFSGNMEAASAWLGRPYSLSGKVMLGRQLARQWGFPTANIHVPDGCLLPRFGAYVVGVHLPNQSHTLWGLANIGRRPSVERAGSLAVFLEVHLYDWSEDLYGTSISVDFIHFLREEKKFDSLEALRSQIAVDDENARLFIKKS